MEMEVIQLYCYVALDSSPQQQANISANVMATKMQSSNLYTLDFGWHFASPAKQANCPAHIEHIGLNANAIKALHDTDLLDVRVKISLACSLTSITDCWFVE